jgi:hypothetical protein
MVCMRAKIHLMKEGNDFKKHIKHDHDFWKYLKFLAYLTSKNKEDQTGFEDLVWRNYVAKLVDWIPSVDVSNYE